MVPRGLRTSNVSRPASLAVVLKTCLDWRIATSLYARSWLGWGSGCADSWRAAIVSALFKLFKIEQPAGWQEATDGRT